MTHDLDICRVTQLTDEQGRTTCIMLEPMPGQERLYKELRRAFFGSAPEGDPEMPDDGLPDETEDEDDE